MELIYGAGKLDRRVESVEELLREWRVREADWGELYLEFEPSTPSDVLLVEDLAVTMLINSRVAGQAAAAVLRMGQSLDRDRGREDALRPQRLHSLPRIDRRKCLREAAAVAEPGSPGNERVGDAICSSAKEHERMARIDVRHVGEKGDGFRECGEEGCHCVVEFVQTPQAPVSVGLVTAGVAIGACLPKRSEADDRATDRGG